MEDQERQWLIKHGFTDCGFEWSRGGWLKVSRFSTARVFATKQPWFASGFSVSGRGHSPKEAIESLIKAIDEANNRVRTQLSKIDAAVAEFRWSL